MRIRHVPLALVATAVLLSGCSSGGGSDDANPTPQPPPAGDSGGSGDTDGNDAPTPTGSNGLPVVDITVRGTEAVDPIDGFMSLEGACDDSSTPQDPNFGAFDVQVPEEWVGTSASKDPQGGSVNFTIDDSSRELDIGLKEQDPSKSPEEMLTLVSLGEDLEEVFTIEWGEEEHPVFEAGTQYLAAVPAIDVDTMMSVPIYTIIKFGYGNLGEIPLDPDVVQQVFDSVVLLECGIEPYVTGYPDANIIRIG